MKKIYCFFLIILPSCLQESDRYRKMYLKELDLSITYLSIATHTKDPDECDSMRRLSVYHERLYDSLHVLCDKAELLENKK